MKNGDGDALPRTGSSAQVKVYFIYHRNYCITSRVKNKKVDYGVIHVYIDYIYVRYKQIE